LARSPRAAGAIGSDDYTGFSLILICVGLGILGWAGWKLWHPEISIVALAVAHREMQVIAFFSERFSQADTGVLRANPAVVQFNDLVRLYRNIGTEFLYPAMALVLALGALCFVRAGNARFTRAFDLDMLMEEQAKTSRCTAAFVRRGLKLARIRAGDPRPADPALHASDWIARYATRDGRFDEASAPSIGRRMAKTGGRPAGGALHADRVRAARRPASGGGGGVAWSPFGGPSRLWG
jgi:intracellular multiplication protein IcmP